uniref:Nodulin 22 n=1 Tax=Phaseolus vulgaris TaxID=3885 RepID=A0A165D0X1_PHAVU|nr:nodulin 22 [Phaseolus vulgaris]
MIQKVSLIFIVIIAVLILVLQSSAAFHSSKNSIMKVHPVPRKRNISIQFGVDGGNPMSEAQALLGIAGSKKLRRLPHVFSCVLELPFRSDADVVVEEDPDCFRFVAETEGIGDVRAHTIEIHPGVTKIVVRDGGSVELSLDQLELDMWRFRLPESTRPELASAVFVDGELIVTVPKGHGEEDGDGDRVMGGGRLVLVQ